MIETEKWNLYHIPTGTIHADKNLKYWTLIQPSDTGNDILGVCTKVYEDGSIDFLGKESNMTNRSGVICYDAEITNWHPMDCSNVPVEIHLTDVNGNVNTYRRIDLEEGANSNVF